jgi:hypothetical protein
MYFCSFLDIFPHAILFFVVNVSCVMFYLHSSKYLASCRFSFQMLGMLYRMYILQHGLNKAVADLQIVLSYCFMFLKRFEYDSSASKKWYSWIAGLDQIKGLPAILCYLPSLILYRIWSFLSCLTTKTFKFANSFLKIVSVQCRCAEIFLWIPLPVLNFERTCFSDFHKTHLSSSISCLRSFQKLLANSKVFVVYS